MQFSHPFTGLKNPGQYQAKIHFPFATRQNGWIKTIDPAASGYFFTDVTTHDELSNGCSARLVFNFVSSGAGYSVTTNPFN
jgi:hypothetical protein